MSRSKTKSFMQEFEIVSGDNFSALLVSEDHARRHYNAVLESLLKSLKDMSSSEAYQAARLLPKGSKDRQNAFSAVQTKFGLTEYAAISLSSQLRSGSADFDLHLPSKVAQENGKRAFRAVQKKMYGKAKRCRFKSKGLAYSMRGSSNKEAPQIKVPEDFSQSVMIFRKQTFKLKVSTDNPFHVHALKARVKNTVVFRREIRGQWCFFVQLCLEGESYRDQSKEIKHRALLTKRFGADIFSRTVSVDFGPKKIAVSNGKVSYERVIVKDSLKEKMSASKNLQRQMSRSIRLANPEAFKTGKLKKGIKLRKTKNYIKLGQQRRDIERKTAAHKKTILGNLSHEIMQLGSTIKLENISYKALQKRYGKSVGESAPSSLKASLFRTAEKLGGSGELINTFDTRLSQTCLCGKIEKNFLWERVHSCNNCGLRVQRDILSAFLGCFTQNEVSRKGRKEIITSSLDLASARSAAALLGYQTFTPSGGPSSENYPKSKFKDQSLCCDREEIASVENSEERQSRALLEFESVGI